MFKIISLETKKVLSKPGIYILAILLAAILVLGVFVYEPTEYKDTTVDLGSSVEEIYANFYGTNINSGYKSTYDNMVDKTIEQIENYKIQNSNYQTYINELKTTISKNLVSYQECQMSNKFFDADNCRNRLVSSLKELKTVVSNAYQLSSNKTYALLSSKKNYDSFEENINDAIELLNTPVEQNQIAERCLEYQNLYESQINKCLSDFIYPTLTQTLINNYTENEGSKYNKIRNRLADADTKINTLYNAIKTDATTKQIEELNNLCNYYISLANTYTNLVYYEVLSNAFFYIPTSKQMSISFLENSDEFSANTNLIRYQYLFENGLTEKDYARPLTIGTTSNTKTNAYDYAYFVLRMFSFVIIAYAIMSGCHAIAGEIKDGSMRYLAIRPVSRTKLLFGKLFAIIFMSTIMTIFSTIIAICVGNAVYGMESLKILTIFNGSTAITLHPLAMLAIFVVSMLIELTIYTSIAMMLSCLIKSDLLAVTILLVIYLLNILLPAFVANPNSWLAFYPFSHISLYALFGSSVYATNDNFLNMILSAKVFTNTTLWLTLAIIVAIIAVVNFISSRVFKNKEL